MQIQETMPLYPQMCFFTMNQKVSPVIDTGIERGEWGRIYIGLDYVSDLATKAGFVPGTELDALKKALSVANARATSAERELAELKESIDVTTVTKGIRDGAMAAVSAAVNSVLRDSGVARVQPPASGERGASPDPVSPARAGEAAPVGDRPSGFPKPGGVRTEPLGKHIGIATPSGD